MEIIDIYDKDRKRTGKSRARNEKFYPGEYSLVVHVCIFNSKGELLIQKRSDSKGFYAGFWDLSAGGHTVSGEESFEAVVREAEEELGIDISDSYEFGFSECFMSAFDDIFFFRIDKDVNEFTFQESEISELKWASREEVFFLQKRGKFVDYTVEFLNKVFDWEIENE